MLYGVSSKVLFYLLRLGSRLAQHQQGFVIHGPAAARALLSVLGGFDYRLSMYSIHDTYIHHTVLVQFTRILYCTTSYNYKLNYMLRSTVLLLGP